ncbi:hypothetical protein ACE193_05985 [Bernardetia sp. OM2101]|uniref:hypothetical protein n=1 Tax=Bernardetia sp. OM2101 TaxID=3344876 RepID=UPI0035D0A19C
MGAQINIRLESDKYDDKKLAPFLGRDFYWEITRGYRENQEPFLSEEEINLLEAPFYEDFEDNSVKQINPNDLKVVIEKVKKYLEENKDLLPFEIDLDFERMDKEDIETDIIINESKCWIKGQSLYHSISDKVRIINYPTEKNEVDIWVTISDEIKIEGRKYYLKKTSMYEKHFKKLDQVLQFCRLAEDRNEKIYWLYEH